MKGENDLATRRPDIAKEWHPQKNGEKRPENYMEYSNTKIQWICQNGHEWEARISDRSRGSGCPFCSGNLPIEGENDFLTIYPEIAMEWCYEMNNSLMPQNFTAHSGIKVWWKCKLGHTWEASINNRSKGSGCPYCNGRRPVIGKTDLSTKYPKLVEEWSKKNKKTPQNYTYGSKYKAKWICKEGHEWTESIWNRVKGSRCPYCAGKKAIQGKNDLKTVFPEILEEWDYEKNKDILPEQFLPYSNKKVFWICKKCGYSWKAVIGSRTTGRGCPKCSGKIK